MQSISNHLNAHTPTQAPTRCEVKWITFLAITCMLVITGCETLSISTFPSEKRAINSALPTGKFKKITPDQGGDESIEISISQLGYRVQSKNMTEYLELFELNGFLGFGSRNALPIQSEMESLPQEQRDMIEDAFETGLHPWRFGVIEMYDDAILMLIPSLIVDEVHEYVESNDFQLINGGISDSAAEQIAANERLVQAKENAGPLEKHFGLYNSSSAENAILLVSPQQLEKITAELLQKDLLVLYMFIPESHYSPLLEIEDGRLDAIR